MSDGQQQPSGNNKRELKQFEEDTAMQDLDRSPSARRTRLDVGDNASSTEAAPDSMEMSFDDFIQHMNRPEMRTIMELPPLGGFPSEANDHTADEMSVLAGLGNDEAFGEVVPWPELWAAEFGHLSDHAQTDYSDLFGQEALSSAMAADNAGGLSSPFGMLDTGSPVEQAVPSLSPAFANAVEVPPLPDLDSLPLTDPSLPPLPDLAGLPFSDFEFPPLPDFDGLPVADPGAPPLPDPAGLPFSDFEFPPLPDFDGLPVADPGAPPLPDLAGLPFSDFEFPPLPDFDGLPVAGPGSPPLPDLAGLPLTDFGALFPDFDGSPSSGFEAEPLSDLHGLPASDFDPFPISDLFGPPFSEHGLATAETFQLPEAGKDQAFRIVNDPVQSSPGKMDRTRDIPGFPPSTTPLPPNLTLEQTCWYYPNHLRLKNLRPFIKAGWTGGRIWNNMQEAAKKTNSKTQSWNKMTKRVLGEKKRMVLEAATLTANALLNQALSHPVVDETREGGPVGLSTVGLTNPPETTGQVPLVADPAKDVRSPDGLRDEAYLSLKPFFQAEVKEQAETIAQILQYQDDDWLLLSNDEKLSRIKAAWMANAHDHEARFVQENLVDTENLPFDNTDHKGMLSRLHELLNRALLASEPSLGNTGIEELEEFRKQRPLLALQNELAILRDWSKSWKQSLDAITYGLLWAAVNESDLTSIGDQGRNDQLQGGDLPSHVPMSQQDVGQLDPAWMLQYPDLDEGATLATAPGDESLFDVLQEPEASNAPSAGVALTEHDLADLDNIEAPIDHGAVHEQEYTDTSHADLGAASFQEHHESNHPFNDDFFNDYPLATPLPDEHEAVVASPSRSSAEQTTQQFWHDEQDVDPFYYRFDPGLFE